MYPKPHFLQSHKNFPQKWSTKWLHFLWNSFIHSMYIVAHPRNDSGWQTVVKKQKQIHKQKFKHTAATKTTTIILIIRRKIPSLNQGSKTEYNFLCLFFSIHQTLINSNPTNVGHTHSSGDFLPSVFFGEQNKLIIQNK